MDAEDAINQPLPPLVKSASRSSLDDGISWYYGNIKRDTAESILEKGMLTYLVTVASKS